MQYITGAYRWRNKIDGKIYIGGAYASFSDRKRNHQRALRFGYHSNCHFQRAWNKYGEESFVFEILERCPPEMTEFVEQKWLDHYIEQQKQLYNISPFAGRPPSALGKKRSEETCHKLSLALKGNSNSLGSKRSLASKVKISKAAKLRMSDPIFLAASLKKLHTSAARRKIAKKAKECMSDLQMRLICAERARKIMQSPEVRKKLAIASKQQWSDPVQRKKKLRGMKRIKSTPEYQQKHLMAIREWHKQPANKASVIKRNRSLEHRKKVSVGMLGHFVSEETKMKLSQKARMQWNNPMIREKMLVSMKRS